MIRKMLVTAAAVTMSMTTVGVASVAMSGEAGAAAKVYTSQTCTISGGVTFAPPGLSHNGTLGKKSSVKSTSAITATGAGCGTSGGTTTSISNKIVTQATDCTVPATPPATLPGACDTYVAGGTAKYAYDNASNLATAGVSSICSALSAKPIKAVNNGNKVSLIVNPDCSGVNSVVPGGKCGATGLGFDLSGNTSVTGLTYEVLLCITGDTGTSTTNSFFTDYLGAAGNAASPIVIASGTFGGSSALTFTKA